MRRLLALLTALCALALGGPAAGVAGDCAPGADWPAANAAFASAVVDLVNGHRAGLGLPPLAVSGSLTGSAVWKARHMAMYRYMQHADPAPPVDRSTGARLSACGYGGGSWGENIAYGYQSPDAVVAGWLASSGHRANIENASFNAIGVGAATAATGAVYWAQNFGVVAGGPPPSSPPPVDAPPADPDPVPPVPVVVPADPPASPAAPGASQPGGDPAPSTPPSEAPGNADEPEAGPPPAGPPAAFRVQAGKVSTGAVSSLAADDGRYLVIRSRRGRTAWYATVSGVERESGAVTVGYRGSTSSSCRQSISVWSWTARAWRLVDSRRVGLRELEVRSTLGGDPADYVRDGDGAVRVRVLCTRGDRSGFATRADLLTVSSDAT